MSKALLFTLLTTITLIAKDPLLCSSDALLSNENSCPAHLEISIGLLYQQPTFDKPISTILYSPSYSDVTSGGEYIDQDIEFKQECFDYALGLTAGLGYFLPHDNWKVQARVDWLQTYKDDEIDTVDNSTLFIRPFTPLFDDLYIGTGFDIETTSFSKLKYREKLFYTLLDVFLSKGNYTSEKLSLRPIAGVKALWFSYDQVSRYYAPQLTYASRASYGKAVSSYGAGPLFGMHLDYCFTDNLSLFSLNDVAVLFGTTSNALLGALVDLTTVQVEGNIIDSEIGGTNDGVVFLPIRSIIGLQLNNHFFNQQHFLSLRLGYDVKVIVCYPVVSNGIGMAGLFADLRWSF